MTLTDSGPLVALLDRDDPYHNPCSEAVLNLSKPLLTTLPALTEAMYFLGEQFGWRSQELLWKLVTSGELEIAPVEGEVLARLPILMQLYQDAPMDMADASLVAVAEAMDLRRIFTIDSHFYAYRMRNGRTFEVIPGSPHR
ncbi:MAG TPA: PIN domain-containing protein [Chthonomonadaceae bacterium]|nr:PIN domain-containing protein [Chthonomonadaceae bacterium]